MPMALGYTLVCLIIDRCPGSIIIQAKVSEVTGPINKPGFPRHRINLNNPPGKKKIQAILSKVTGPNKDTGKS